MKVDKAEEYGRTQNEFDNLWSDEAKIIIMDGDKSRWNLCETGSQNKL